MLIQFYDRERLWGCVYFALSFYIGFPDVDRYRESQFSSLIRTCTENILDCSSCVKFAIACLAVPMSTLVFVRTCVSTRGLETMNTYGSEMHVQKSRVL